MPIAGRMYDRIGVKLPVGVGIVIMSGSILALRSLEADSSALHICGLMAINGVGMGLAFMPLNTACLAAAETENSARASSLVSVTFQVAAATAVAVSASILQSRTAHYLAGGEDPLAAATSGFHDAWLFAGLLAAPAFVATMRIVVRRQPASRPAGLPEPAS
jgi:MFS family permease